MARKESDESLAARLLHAAITVEQLIARFGFRMRTDGLVLIKECRGGRVIWVTNDRDLTVAHWFIAEHDKDVLGSLPLPLWLNPITMGDVESLIALVEHAEQRYIDSRLVAAGGTPCLSSNA